jgi:hypothetical protein
MQYLLGSSQVLAGLGSLAVLWLVIGLLNRRNTGRPLPSSLTFSTVPAFFLIWAVAGVVLILSGFGVL